MTLKIIGAVLIVISSTMYGIKLSSKYEMRIKIIRDFQTALKILETEITFLRTPLPEAFCKISNSLITPVKDIFKECVKIYGSRNEESISAIFEKVFFKYNNQLNIKEADREIIISFMRQLGSSDVDNQISNIKHTYYKLGLCEKDAISENNKNSRLLRSLGLLFGIMIVLIFI